MTKNIIVYILSIILFVLFMSIIFSDFGMKIAVWIFSNKNFIKINEIDKAILYYTEDDFSEKFTKNSMIYKVEITDTDFLNLIENTYKNKIVNNYWTGGILYKGKFKLTINDNIELYTCDKEGFYFKYNDEILKVKFNQKIFDKMVEIIESYYDVTVSQAM